MAVITISRQVGAGATEVATRLCELLGYTFFNKQLMTAVAADVGLSAYEVIDFSEDNYKTKGFLERLFGFGGRRSPTGETRPVAPDEVAPLTVEQLDEPRCVDFVRSTILAAYQRGNVVVVGRGGQAILKDMPDVLHVRLEAPEGARIRRIMEREGWSFSRAYQLMVDRDRAASQYLSVYFNIRWDDPMLYHLIVNTGKMDLIAAAQLIVTAVRALEAAPVGAAHVGSAAVESSD